MVVKKKKSPKKRSAEPKEEAEIKAEEFLTRPIGEPLIVPPEPLPFENLVGYLSEREVEEFDLFGLKITRHALSRLTVQEIRDLLFIFEVFTPQKTPHGLDKESLRKTLLALGFVTTNDNKVNVWFNDYCSDGDAGLSFNEFLHLIGDIQSEGRDYSSEIERTFQQIDDNENGAFDMRRLREHCISLGIQLTGREIEEMIDLADTNGDGVVEFDEFRATMLQTHLF